MARVRCGFIASRCRFHCPARSEFKVWIDESNGSMIELPGGQRIQFIIVQRPEEPGRKVKATAARMHPKAAKWFHCG
jgi:hypothetical protein